jgi:hypothetical protein
MPWRISFSIQEIVMLVLFASLANADTNPEVHHFGIENIVK